MKSPTCMLAGTMIVLALTISQSLAQTTYEPYTFTTFAGSASNGSADGTGRAARFWNPTGVAADSVGKVFVADTGNHTIRKVTPARVVTTLAGLAGFAGSADGIGSAARFNEPSGVAVDNTGNVYVADSGNHTIRKVTPAGVVTTLAGLVGSFGSADGIGSAARFNSPGGVAVDNAGNVYVADSRNSAIRKVTPAGMVTTLAGSGLGSTDGTGSDARFNIPYGVAVDSAGNVYVAEYPNNTIRKVTPAGMVTTLAGLALNFGSSDGTGSAAQFWNPNGVAVDSAGNVYVADSRNSTIRKVTPAGMVTTLAGLADSYGNADGLGSASRFRFPQGVAVDSADNVYVADSINNEIRKVTPAGAVTSLAGNGDCCTDGPGSVARFAAPSGVAVDNTGNVYVADSSNHTIRKVTPAGMVTTLAGLGGNSGRADGPGSVARFWVPSAVAVDSAGNIYVADAGNSTIRRVTPAGLVTTMAGLAGSSGSANGTGSAARFSSPSGVAVESAGNVYVADTFSITLRKVTPTGVVTTLAGLALNEGSADGTGSEARFFEPYGVAVDSAGNVYVADTFNHMIRKVTPAGVVTTLAGGQTSITNNFRGGYADGTGSDARFSYPYGLAVDSMGDVYVADTNNEVIRKVSPAGVVTTLAGLTGSGTVDGTGSAARFNYPRGVAVDSAGNIYVADTGNNTIRKGSRAFMILHSGPGFGFSGGQFGFNLTGPAGRFVVVEASTDLLSWLPLWTNTFTFPAALNFIDPQSAVYSKRFYRAHLR